MDLCKYIKGGVWWFDYGTSQRGLMSGRHMAVIVSQVSNPNNACTCTIVPITSAKSAEQNGALEEFHYVPIKINHDSYVGCNQIQTIVTNKLTSYVGQLTDSKIREIDEGIKKYLMMEDTSKIQVTSNDIIDLEAARKISEVPTITYDAPISNDSDKKNAAKEPTAPYTEVDNIPTKTTKPVYYCVETNKQYSTMKDIADEENRTISTVSKAIRDNRKVGGKTYRRITPKMKVEA